MATQPFLSGWCRTVVLALLLAGWTGYALAQPTAAPATQPAAEKKAPAKKAAVIETPIPVPTSDQLKTYRPTAAEVLTPPEQLGADVLVAKTPPVIDFGVFPGQFQPAKLWSNWGDSAYINGSFYGTIGDHASPYGTSFVYKVDPASKTMQKVVDYNQVVGLTDKTQYAPGKIHSPLMDGKDGWLYFFGYTGGGTSAAIGYKGDWLLRHNPATGVTENLGIPIADNTVACSEFHAPTRTIYVLPNAGQTMQPERKSQFYAYNVDTRQVVFAGGPPPLMARAMMVAPDGRVYYSAGKPGTGKAPDAKNKKGEPPVGVLAKYDPRTNQVTMTDIRVPGDGTLRAASHASRDGIIYGFSKDGVVFSFDTRTEQIKEITKATFAGPGYTASIKLDPTERYLYYIPSAHGGSKAHGSALIQLDLKTGQRKALAFLNDYMRTHEKYNLGGTFGIALNDDASQVFVCWNGRPLGGKNDDFGQCSAMIIHIPEDERSAK